VSLRRTDTPVELEKEVVPVTELLHDQAPLPNPEPGPPRRPWDLRAAVIIPLVLVVMAAAVVATVLVATRSDSGGSGPTSQAQAVAPAPAAVLVPIHATATSAMTGAPLAITLKLPDGTGVPVEANGTVTTDWAGPGDQVQVIATGYVTAPATVGAVTG
jgi:hypothetical protein